jgi:deoxyribodipyrimidine photo-lyase
MPPIAIALILMGPVNCLLTFILNRSDPHTLALAVQMAHAPLQDRQSFLEELIVRRELAINFVRYNQRYDSLASSEPWAERTLRLHAGDERR